MVQMPKSKVIVIAGGVFLTTIVLLFTWFGQNWSGLADLFRAVPHLASRAGGEGHEKPFWYYARLLADGWSGAVLLGLATLGIFRARQAGPRLLLVVYALLIAVIYSAIPYKTPWLALNFWLPLALLAGFAVEWLWRATSKPFPRALILIGLTTVGFLMAHDTRKWVFQIPADEKNPYAYAHTSEDLLSLPKRLEELTQQKNISNPRITVIAADAWPLPWYLRKFSQAGFLQPGQAMWDADFFITTSDLSDELAERLKHLRPEFFGWRPGVILILWTPAPAKSEP